MSERVAEFNGWRVHERDWGVDGGAPSAWYEVGPGVSVVIGFLTYERTVAIDVVDPDGDGKPGLTIEIPSWELPLIVGAVQGLCASQGLRHPLPPAAVEVLAGWLGWTVRS